MQYKKLETLMPIARKLAKVSSYKFICAILCIIANSYKLGALPENMKSIAQFI